MLVLSGGTNWFFTVKQYAIRKEMKKKIKAGVPKEELYYFQAINPETDFHWIKPEKEFEWNHQLFDVVTKVQLENGTFELACVNDIQEQQLFKELDLITHKKSGKKNFYIQFQSPIFFVEELISTPLPEIQFYSFQFKEPQSYVEIIDPCKNGYLLSLDKPPEIS